VLLHAKNSDQLNNSEQVKRGLQSGPGWRPAMHAAAAGFLRTALWTVRLRGADVHGVGDSPKPLSTTKLCLLDAARHVSPVSPRRHRSARGRWHGNCSNCVVLNWFVLLKMAIQHTKVHIYVRPQKLFPIHLKFGRYRRSMSDAWRYAIWPDPRSRLRPRDVQVWITTISKSISSVI